MIRDLSKTDKIKYSKKFIELSTRTFLRFWFINPEGMFEDIDFYVANTFWNEYTLKAKISGAICGILVLPFIFITFILILVIANVTRQKDPEENTITTLIGKGIVLLLLLLPFALIRFPFSLYSYFAFQKKALFYLLEMDSDDTLPE